MIAITVVATASLMLVATLSSQQKMNALARERSIATNAVRAYIEAMRQYYPTSGSTDMSGYLYDAATPADFLPTLGVEKSALGDARGLVLKMTDETGSTWGPAAGVSFNKTSSALAWLWADATMTNSTAIAATTTTTYTHSSTGTPYANGFPSLSELECMGFVTITGTPTLVGRDLNGDGTIANPSGQVYVAPSGQVFVPAQITLSWNSGSGGSESLSSNAAVRRQRMTVYAAFGPTH